MSRFIVMVSVALLGCDPIKRDARALLIDTSDAGSSAVVPVTAPSTVHDGDDAGSAGSEARTSPRGLAHPTRIPTLTEGEVRVQGATEPEVVRRIIRQNFGRFRLCYDNGLRSHPLLAGRVSVKVVIDRSGAVTGVQDDGSDLPDKEVVACIVRGFHNLSFPRPTSGIVTVSYSFLLSPSS